MEVLKFFKTYSYKGRVFERTPSAFDDALPDFSKSVQKRLGQIFSTDEHRWTASPALSVLICVHLWKRFVPILAVPI
jgi:hypothetical protein